MRDYTYRRVPFLLGISILTGGAVQQIGWLFLCIGTVFSTVFLGMADIDFNEFGSGTVIVEGKIKGVENTKARINNSYVRRYIYEFKDLNGMAHNGVSYTTSGFSIGRAIKVEYDPQNPQWSRAEHMTRKEFGSSILFILIFPFVGFMLVAVPMFLARKKLRLLKTGILTTGEMCGKEPTNLRINNRTVYRYTFKFTDSRRKDYFHVEKTQYSENVEDDHRERLLYLPENPAVACLVDVIGVKFDLDERGELTEYSIAGAVKVLIIPVIAFTVIVCAAIYMD